MISELPEKSTISDDLPPQETAGIIHLPPFGSALTDRKIAEHFVRVTSDFLRYWPERKRWIVFDGKRWTESAPGGPFPAFAKMLDELYRHAIKLPGDMREAAIKSVTKYEKYSSQKDAVAAAANIPAAIIQSHQLDANDMLLNVNNGFIDLRTGALWQHSAGRFMARIVPIDYDPAATCPTFDKFLQWAMCGDDELIEYLQRFFGYCLTGRTDEQVLLFLYGHGSNGKTVLVNVLRTLLGEYAATARKDLVMVRDNRGPGNDVAGLRGSRLVCVSELEESDRIAEAEVKSLTGGDVIACRFLYCEEFSYKPHFKLVLFGNHKPKVRGRDHGIWRRIHLLPFENTINDTEKDGQLGDKLQQELPGILAWAVRGCLEWRERGLRPPQKVLAAVQEYRKGEDIFQQWIDECCQTGPQYSAKPTALLDSFIEFSRLKNTSSQKLAKMLAEAGFTQERGYTGRLWCGIGLMTAADRLAEPPPF